MKKKYSIILSVFMLISIISMFPYVYISNTTKSLFNSTNSICIGDCEHEIYILDGLGIIISFSLMVIINIIFIIIKINQK